MNYLVGFMLINGLSKEEVKYLNNTQSFHLFVRLLIQHRFDLKSLFKEGMPQIKALSDAFDNMLQVLLYALLRLICHYYIIKLKK